jgi:hypothetical protein
VPDKNRKLIDESKSRGAPAAAPRPRATKVSQFEKDFRDYLAAQQEARQQMVKDIAAGFAAAPLGYLAQIPLGIPDLASLVLPDAITENQFYPSTENAIKHAANAARNIPGLSDYADTMEAGMEAGQYAAIPQAIMAVPGMVKAVGRGAKAVGKEAGRRIDEAMMTGEGMLGSALAPARPNFMFIGPSAKTWNKSAAFKASQMERAGKSPEEIWAATKTFKGADGNWRQEVSDQSARFQTEADMKAKAAGMKEQELANKALIAESKLYPDLFPKQLTAAQKDLRAQTKALRDERTAMHGPETGSHWRGNFAKYALDHPELYEAYPELADMIIKQGGQGRGGARATLWQSAPAKAGDPLSSHVSMDIYESGLKNDPRSSALHEMQHAIQGVEGWSPGGSPMMAFKDPRSFDILNSLRQKAMTPMSFEDYAQRFAHVSDLNKGYEQYKSSIPGLVQKMDRELQTMAAQEYYRRLTGEAEARATQARRDMGATERAQTMPGESFDVPLSDQIVKPADYAHGGTISRDAMQIKAWDKQVQGKAKGGLTNVGKSIGKAIDIVTDLKAAPKVGVASPLAMRSAADKAEEALQKMQAFKSLKGQDRQRAIDSVRAKAERSGIPRTKADLNAATAGEEDIARSMLNSPAYKIANVVPKATVNKALETRQMYRAEPPTTPGPNASEKEWADWGASHGVNMTVTTPESLGISDLTSRREAMIPGGLKGTFTIPDLFWMKANNFNPAALPQDVHTELMKKFIRTNKISSPDEVDVFNRLNFALLSPNAPLTPNEFLAQRARLRTPEELSALAGRVGEEGLNRTAATQLGVGQAGSGGMGVLGTADLSSQAMLAKLIKDKPSMFQMAPGETMRDVTIRVMNQAPGLGPKTASLGTPWLDLEKANTSAVDLHMIRDAYPMLLHDPIVGDAFRERMAALLKTKPTAAAILSKPEKDVRDAAIAIVGGTDMSRLYRLKSGELNRIPDVATPDKLAYEPKSFSEFNPFYSRVVDYVDQSRGANPDIELFPEQWRKWDVLRQRIEPHEFAHPDYRKLPRQSFSEMQDALTAHKEAGYTQSSNPTMNLSDWRKLYYGRAVPEILAPTAAAGAAAAAAQTLLSDDSEKARGGAVHMAEGGMTSDDLIVEERPF